MQRHQLLTKTMLNYTYNANIYRELISNTNYNADFLDFCEFDHSTFDPGLEAFRLKCGLSTSHLDSI
jgi:hypothetical protein